MILKIFSLIYNVLQKGYFSIKRLNYLNKNKSLRKKELTILHEIQLKNHFLNCAQSMNILRKILAFKQKISV